MWCIVKVTICYLLRMKSKGEPLKQLSLLFYNRYYYRVSFFKSSMYLSILCS